MEKDRLEELVEQKIREELDPKEGNTHKYRAGFKCIECGNFQLTREVPERHAEDSSLNFPDKADRDMVREDNS